MRPATPATGQVAAQSATADVDLLTPAARRKLRAQLIRLKEGDRTAFTAVFDTLHPLTVAFARRMVGDVEAEDAAQQALLKLFAQAAAYDETKDVAAWALSLTAWECRTIRTRNRRRKEVPMLEVDSDPVHDPRDDLFERKVIEEARAVLKSLSPADQETLQRAFAGDGCGPTFRKRKQRAIARLIHAWRTIHG